VFAGSSAGLEQHLGPGAPLWGRQYLFWHAGRPLTLIHEVFSRRLDEYLGPLG
jgi:chorismate lyase